MNPLEARIAQLEAQVAALQGKSDRFTFSKSTIELPSSGLRIGTGASQKLSFYGKTPVVAWASGLGRAPDVDLGVGTDLKDGARFTGGIGSTAFNVGDIVAGLKTLGLFAD